MSGISRVTVETVYERLLKEINDEIDGYSATDLNDDIDVADLRLLKSSFVDRFRTISINNEIDSAMHKFQIEFKNKYRYIYTFSIIHSGGTPGCCATYTVTYSKDKFEKCTSDDEESASDCASDS
jgi:hypothetical protein